MRTPSFAIFAAAAVLCVTGCGGGSTGTDPFTVALFGDVPYGTSPADTSQTLAFPGMVSQINSDADVSLAVHVGDIHSGKQYCTQAYDQQVFDIVKAFTKPFIYTPGDNEWADCHKAGEGGGTYTAATGTITYVTDSSGNPVDYKSGNPVENLALVRSIFFANAGQAIGGAMSVHSQATEFDATHPADAQYVENVWFMRNNVLFVTVNIPGGSNNGTDPWYGAPAMSDAQQQEVASRTGAATRWIARAFDVAKSASVSAVAIVAQADMWDLDGKSPSHIAGYKPYVDAMATGAAAFDGPVILFNGDSHTYRSDNPLQPNSPCLYEPTSGGPAVACTFDAYANQPNGYNVPNFHRVVVHGSTNPLEWVKLTVTPKAAGTLRGDQQFGPFSWARVKVS